MTNLSKDSKTQLTVELSELLKEKENKYCAECGANSPRWTSYNLGVFLCLRCAGLHRSLGTHISKVKSITLDSWTPEQVQSMKKKGNKAAASYFEATVPTGYSRPQDDRSILTFIKKKYEYRAYINSTKTYEDYINAMANEKKANIQPETPQPIVGDSTAGLYFDSAPTPQATTSTIRNDLEDIFMSSSYTSTNHGQQMTQQDNMLHQNMDLFRAQSPNSQAIKEQPKSFTNEQLMSLYHQPAPQPTYYQNQFAQFNQPAAVNYTARPVVNQPQYNTDFYGQSNQSVIAFF